MMLAPAFSAAFLFLIKEKWANSSESLQWLAGFLAVFAIFQLLSLSWISALLRSLGAGIFCINGGKRIRAEDVWISLVNEKERFGGRLLASKTMALWPVFAAVTAAILGLPDWSPKWQGDRIILVIALGAFAFYGQRRGAYEQAQYESRISSLVTATKLAERDCEAERRKRDDIARNRENSERDLEIERRKQKDLLAALKAESAWSAEPAGNLGQLELRYRNGVIRLNAVQRILTNAPNIVKDAFRKLFDMQPALIQPGGNAYTHRRLAACLRDMDIILRYITYAAFGGDSSILEERCINGLRETYLALGVPIAATAEGIRIMKGLVISTVNDPEGDNIVDGIQYSDYSLINNEIAGYFDLVIQALS
jgi:phycocyanin beta chain